MAKVRVRRLWLNVIVDPESVSPKYSKRDVLKILRRSITRGDYELPRGWRVVLEWRNKADQKMRAGEWTTELERSAESSDGFDQTVLDYLDRKLERGRE